MHEYKNQHISNYIRSWSYYFAIMRAWYAEHRTGLGRGWAGLEPAPAMGLPEMVRQFKTFSARRINSIRQTPGQPLWQRNYYEFIIRDNKSLHFIRNYIRENPLNWKFDGENHIDREIQELESMETVKVEEVRHGKAHRILEA